MASSSGNENNNQNMVDSAKAADVTVIPKEDTSHKRNAHLEKFYSSRNYDSPRYIGPRSDDVPEVKSIVVGDHRKGALEMYTKAENEEHLVRKMSRLRVEESMWGHLTHESVLRDGRYWQARMFGITEDQAGDLVPQKQEEWLLEKQQDVQ